MNAFLKNFDSIIDELFGEKTDFPLLTRLLAFTIDYLLFTIVSFLIIQIVIGGMTFTGSFFTGFFTWLLYAGIGNSKLFKGQTIGKKILKMSVVNSDGLPLGVGRSTLRALPLALLINTYQLMGLAIIDFQNPVLEISAVALLVFLLVGEIYFPIVSLNRRSLHDLVLSSFVVTRKCQVVIEGSKLRRWTIVVYVFLVATGLIPFIIRWISPSIQT